MERSVSIALLTAIAAAPLAAGQPVPRPFPAPPGGQPTAAEQVPAPPDPGPQDSSPTEATLGFPIYPNAAFITSFDAGRGQRYYLFGTNATFGEMVRYYSIVLDERGDRAFDGNPPTHVFEIGRFREETMAFPPGVTIKDFAWNGADGFINPAPDADPPYYRTIIQIVPPPAGEPRR